MNKKILKTREELNNYLQSENGSDPAIYLELDAEFLINKYKHKDQYLQSIDYALDYVQNISSKEYKATYPDYEEDTPLNKNVNVHMGRELFKGSTKIGDCVLDGLGFIYIKLKDVILYYDPRGFLSYVMYNIQGLNNTYFLNEQGEVVLQVINGEILKLNGERMQFKDYLLNEVNKRCNHQQDL